ncbi:outer membrane protein TolC/ABC-type uncharacterized transport system substrate-binding protein [Desulfobaculum xiamenense]|uniref:Outer membrane protein TolC/ABC-type uncharacterized transport system substrate-binding protein n=1 Tax=Desulfobaculum xiamenense TaxID=995050 RepID=A0A846QRF7_9BACT|nr:outer membrane protein TolC/ABC-type uncharacterized transport system substrate-binding protein [Desulfobaculum xiamenense]
MAVWLVVACLWLAAVDVAVALAAPHRVVVGVVRDGASPLAEEVLTRVREEFALLTGDEWEVVWKSPDSFSAHWDVRQAGAALDAALADPETDVVFSLGILPTQAATFGERRLGKPVVGGPFIDEESLRLPYDMNRSTRRNLTYIVIPGRVNRDLTSFKDIAPFDTLTVLVDAAYATGLTAFDDVVVRYERLLGIRVRVIPVTDDVDAALAALGDGVQAVYLTPLMRLADEARDRLVRGLADRRIPSFSFIGQPDVERGILAGRSSFSGTHLARRIALNLRDILAGASPNDLPVILPEEERLYINMVTAREIGFSPKYETLLTADLIGVEQAAPGGRQLGLEDAMRIAASENLDLAVKDAEVAGAEQDRLLARSTLLPQVGASIDYMQMDQDRAVASRGLYPWDVTTAGVSLTQMLFDDAAIARFRAAGRGLEAERLARESVRLDVMHTAGRRYLGYLSAEALLHIERENYRLICDNLEMARVRRSAGVSGPEEVYRWEAAQAESKARTIARRADVRSALTALNQALNRPTDAQWVTSPVSAAEARRALFGVEASLIGGTLEQIERISAEAEALAASRPAVAALDSLVEAQGLVLAQKRRTRWVPTLSASAGYAHQVDKHQAGAVIVQDPDPSEDAWTVNLKASLPLFAGGALTHDARRAEAELERLDATRRRLIQLAGQQARTVVSNMTRSYPNMELTALAADRARRNLEVIRDKYARGAVSILDLLDAQNQSRVQEQAAVIAIYAYLGDVLDFQRSVGWFELDRTPEQKRDFLARLGVGPKE